MEQNNQVQQFLTDISKLKAFLDEKLEGIELTHDTFGNGKIIYIESITFSASRSDGIGYVTAMVKFEDTFRKMGIQLRSDRQFFTLPPVLEGVFKILQLVDAAYTEKVKARIKAKEEQEDAERKAKAKEALDKAKAEALLDRVKSLKQEAKKAGRSFGEDLYPMICWIYNNLSEIKATIATPLTDWFKDTFGEAAYTEIALENISAGKNSGIKFSLTTKTGADELPSYLENYLSKRYKQTNNIAFITMLVLNYGFKFGTKEEQDLEEIKKYIPEDFVKELK